MRREITALVLFVVVAPLLARAAGAVTVPAAADAYTSSSTPTKNYGAKKTLLVGAPPATNATFTSYVRFDLSALPPGTTGSDVGKATLTLFAGKVKAAGTFAIYRAGAAWTESGIESQRRSAATASASSATRTSTIATSKLHIAPTSRVRPPTSTCSTPPVTPAGIPR